MTRKEPTVEQQLNLVHDLYHGMHRDECGFKSSLHRLVDSALRDEREKKAGEIQRLIEMEHGARAEIMDLGYRMDGLEADIQAKNDRIAILDRDVSRRSEMLAETRRLLATIEAALQAKEKEIEMWKARCESAEAIM